MAVMSTLSSWVSIGFRIIRYVILFTWIVNNDVSIYTYSYIINTWIITHSDEFITTLIQLY